MKKRFDYTVLLDLINPEKLRRALLYALCLLVMLAFQGCILSRVSILGVRAMAVPCIVVAVGMFEGGLWGGIFGVAAGLLCGGETVIYLLTFAVSGFGAGFLTDMYVNRRLYSCVIVSAAALLLLGLCQTLPLRLYYGASISALARTGLLQSAWSLPFSVPCYFACRAVSRRRDRD